MKVAEQLLSTTIMLRLRAEAERLGRPDVRLATLDRLEKACDAIATGEAHGVVKRSGSSVVANWRKSYVPIIPPRIEEYVDAMRIIEQKDGGDSGSPYWTGPVSSSLRKEKHDMLAYIRAREHERCAVAPNSGTKRDQQDWWHLVEGIDDEILRAKLMRELSEGREAKNQVAALKVAVRICSSEFNIEAYLRGENPPNNVKTPLLPSAAVEEHGATIERLVERLTNAEQLGAFELECDGKRVRQKTTKTPLVEASELAALIAIAKRGK